MLDARDRFTGIAENYRRGRPSYPGALFDWLLGLFAPGRPADAADVGCGTGISARQLAARGLDVVGVDPNEDMLAAARVEGGSVRYVRGDAEATGLPAAAFDLVTAAQALHWFDRPRAFAEFARIARPGAWCAAWWNWRAPSPVNDEIAALLRTYAADPQADGRRDRPEWFAEAPGVGALVTAEFAHRQTLDAAGFQARLASVSYVHHAGARRDELLRAAGETFARHARDGVVTIPYSCRAYAWRPLRAS